MKLAPPSLTIAVIYHNDHQDELKGNKGYTKSVYCHVSDKSNTFFPGLKSTAEIEQHVIRLS